MTVFYVYGHDGGPQDAGEPEFCGNLVVPQTELSLRAASGLGRAPGDAAGRGVDT